MFGRLTSPRTASAIVSVVVGVIVILGSLPLVAAQNASPVASPVAGLRELPPAWLEFGPYGRLHARVIVDGACPALLIDGAPTAMMPRSSPSSDFPVVACEATIPFAARSAVINEQGLPLPDGPIRRIAVIGDTGCRLDDWNKKYQACNDPSAWPFARIAASVAAWEPDLIVHVGDYLYREAACPAGNAGCAGSPHGDNWETWRSDFFTPAAPLLRVAPVLLMRGNHETCDRNAGGWFAYLDVRPFSQACRVYTDPYTATLLGVTFAALDSAEASDTTVKPGEEAEYARQFDVLGEMAPPGSWLVTHRPVWGILDLGSGDVEVENASYEAATGGSLKADYAVVLSGHIHAAETIVFDEASSRPGQIVSGNAGTALDDVPAGTPTARQLGDRDISEAEALSGFGFLTLEIEGDEWLATQRDADGKPISECRLESGEFTCGAGGQVE